MAQYFYAPIFLEDDVYNPGMEDDTGTLVSAVSLFTKSGNIKIIES